MTAANHTIDRTTPEAADLRAAIATTEAARVSYERSLGTEQEVAAWHALESSALVVLHAPGPIRDRLAVFAAAVFDGRSASDLLDSETGEFYAPRIAKVLLAEIGQ